MEATVSRSDRTVLVTAADTLAAYEQTVLVDSTDGAFALTLPPVSEARGLIYTLYFMTDGGDVTIQDQDDSFDWSDKTFAAADDSVALYSDGRKWYVIANEIA
jgi:hypothetical protein